MQPQQAAVTFHLSVQGPVVLGWAWPRQDPMLEPAGGSMDVKPRFSEEALPAVELDRERAGQGVRTHRRAVGP